MVDDPLFFLHQQALVIYSGPLAKKLGIAASVLLSQLVARRQERPIELDDGVWSHITNDELEERTAIRMAQQEAALKALSAAGLITQKVFGKPPRRHFLLHDEVILTLCREA